MKFISFFGNEFVFVWNSLDSRVKYSVIVCLWIKILFKFSFFVGFLYNCIIVSYIVMIFLILVVKGVFFLYGKVGCFGGKLNEIDFFIDFLWGKKEYF